MIVSSDSLSNSCTIRWRQYDDMRDLGLFRMSSLIKDEEYLLKYCKGGYHPTCIGDEFNGGRYRIRMKLGWGGFATVWVAADRRYLVNHQGLIINAHCI